MPETQSGPGGPPSGRRSAGLIAISALAVIFGVVALVLAAWGWALFPPEPGANPSLAMRLLDIAVRTIKVLLLSDIYYDPRFTGNVATLMEAARNFGVLASILFGVRLLLYAMGSHLHALWFRFLSRGHDVVIGSGPAAVEYAANFGDMFPNRRAIHLADERASTVRRLATFARRGNLEAQLSLAETSRARRIIVDEGDDADTWQAAQLIARKCKRAEVLAHITDPWMRDRLSREEPKFGLAAFSFASGAARQVMLAHPPFLLADRMAGATAQKTQHILIVGFGQVGQAVAREFIVTSVVPDWKLKITVVDPQATRLETDFRSRHPDLCAPEGADAGRLDDSHVDFDFVEGDFRLNDPAFAKRIKDVNDATPICAVYVAIDNDSRPLSLALAIRATAAQGELFRAPVFVCAQHGAGLPTVRHGAGLVGQPTGEVTPAALMKVEDDALVGNKLCNLRVVSFGAWRDAFDGCGLREREFDGQARRFHEEYENQRLIEAEEQSQPITTPKPWSVLSDQFRVSNRRVASHIRAKAFAAGFDLGGWLEEESPPAHDLPPAAARLPEVDSPEMLRLGELEHRRWMLDRFLDGWRLGPRDDYARRHPDLVPFAALPENKKKKDYTVILTTRALMPGAEPRRRKKVKRKS